MEETTENTDGKRVTRARTRRMSLLDTDSRPGTPQLDTASDRGTASPRPTRRTRLNSVTLDVRTPTRPTRASLARGETPEPTTPSSVKRTARTPAKTRSVRQQLTLKEEEAEEIERPRSETRTPTPTGEKRVTRSMSRTPPSVTRPSSQPDLSSSPKDKQKPELESVDKPQVLEKEVRTATSIKTQTPMVRVEKLKMVEQAKGAMVLAKEIEQERKSPINQVEVAESTDDYKDSVEILDSVQSQSVANEVQASISVSEPNAVSDSSEPSGNTREIPSSTDSLPVRHPEANDSLEEQEFMDAEESLPVGEPPQGERVSEMEQDSKVEQQVMPKPDAAEPDEEATPPEAPKREEATKETPKKEIIAEITPPEALKPEEAYIESPKEAIIAAPEEEIKPPSTPMDVDEEIGEPIGEHPENVQDPNLTADINPRAAEQKKFVGFNSDTEEVDVEKKRFPKTPGREKVPASFNFTPKPLKTDVEQRRNSSTPILKYQEPESSLDKTEVQPPPLQIDAIKPFDELEKEEEATLVQPENMSPKKAVNKILALLDSDDEPEEIEADDNEGDECEFIEDVSEHEDDGSMCEFIDDDVEEAPAHYQSGDSMDSSERREIVDNEIPCDGESVGSQDTEEESTGDTNDSYDSFVVPDDDVEEDLDPLCYSTNEEDEVENEEATDKKKRRRIFVAESSDDENQGEEQNKSHLAKSKDQSNCSSDASKLSEAAQMMNGSADKASISEAELENSRIVALNELNKSERFNKTATRLDASVLELDSSEHDKEEEEEDGTEKGNRSVFEIVDSEDDMDGVDQEEKEAKNEVVEEEETVGKSPSSQGQKMSKSADEEALLAELASSDLRHLETMFNPLQKSRRQSLLMPGHELPAREPKLKRRSDRALVGADFCPSQSFVEMVAEQKRIKNKRKRLSKSFSGAAEDLEEMEGIHHERKRLKSSRGESTESLEDDDDPQAEASVEHSGEIAAPGPDAFQESDSADEVLRAEAIPNETVNKEAEKVAGNVSLKKSPAKETSLDKSQPKEQYKPTWEVEKNNSIPPVKASTTKAKIEPSSKPKTAEYYLEYCNSILQKANEAVLRKKKEDIAAGKKQKKQKRPAAAAAAKSEQATSVVTVQKGKEASKPALAVPTVHTEKPASKPPPPPKKDLKRLQAARQAVGHAVSLLAPTKIGDKEPRSLARKLSPQPPIQAKKGGQKIKKSKKQKMPETSPLKSSDEENHVVRGNRFRTNAGFVTVSRIDSPPRAPIIELIKTSSGIMRVEPTTPKQKYFRESPATPRNHGFKEKPVTSGHSKKRAKQKALEAAESDKHNPAMRSALRFKEQAFARKF